MAHEIRWLWRGALVRHRRVWFLVALLTLLVAAGFVLQRLGDDDSIPLASFGESRPPPPADVVPDPLLESVEKGPPESGYVPVRMMISRGEIDGRYYAVPG